MSLFRFLYGPVFRASYNPCSCYSASALSFEICLARLVYQAHVFGKRRHVLRQTLCVLSYMSESYSPESSRNILFIDLSLCMQSFSCHNTAPLAVPSTSQDGATVAHEGLSLFCTKNISLHFDSCLQWSFNQTTVTYIESFIAFYANSRLLSYAIWPLTHIVHIFEMRH